MLIYKILTAGQWDNLTARGETGGAPIDVTDGFIHFSTAKQVRETADKHFSGQEGLYLAAFDSAALGPSLTWEASRGGDLFPHLYGPLRHVDVLWSRELPLGPDGHVFPEDIE